MDFEDYLKKAGIIGAGSYGVKKIGGYGYRHYIKPKVYQEIAKVLAKRLLPKNLVNPERIGRLAKRFAEIKNGQKLPESLSRLSENLGQEVASGIGRRYGGSGRIREGMYNIAGRYVGNRLGNSLIGNNEAMLIAIGEEGVSALSDYGREALSTMNQNVRDWWNSTNRFTTREGALNSVKDKIRAELSDTNMHPRIQEAADHFMDNTDFHNDLIEASGDNFVYDESKLKKYIEDIKLHNGNYHAAEQKEIERIEEEYREPLRQSYKEKYPNLDEQGINKLVDNELAGFKEPTYEQDFRGAEPYTEDEFKRAQQEDAEDEFFDSKSEVSDDSDSFITAEDDDYQSMIDEEEPLLGDNNPIDEDVMKPELEKVPKSNEYEPVRTGEESLPIREPEVSLKGGGKGIGRVASEGAGLLMAGGLLGREKRRVHDDGLEGGLDGIGDEIDNLVAGTSDLATGTVDKATKGDVLGAGTNLGESLMEGTMHDALDTGYADGLLDEEQTDKAHEILSQSGEVVRDQNKTGGMLSQVDNRFSSVRSPSLGGGYGKLSDWGIEERPVTPQEVTDAQQQFAEERNRWQAAKEAAQPIQVAPTPLEESDNNDDEDTATFWEDLAKSQQMAQRESNFTRSDINAKDPNQIINFPENTGNQSNDFWNDLNTPNQNTQNNNNSATNEQQSTMPMPFAYQQQSLWNSLSKPNMENGQTNSSEESENRNLVDRLSSLGAGYQPQYLGNKKNRSVIKYDAQNLPNTTKNYSF